MKEVIYSNKLGAEKPTESEARLIEQKLTKLKHELTLQRAQERIDAGEVVDERFKVYLMNYDDTTMRDAIRQIMRGDEGLAQARRQEKVDNILKLVSKYFTAEEIRQTRRMCKKMSDEELDGLYKKFKHVDEMMNVGGLQK